MFSLILLIFFIAIIAFLPVLFWGYIFTYIDSSHLNRKRFILGIVAWIFWVLPIYYFEDILAFLHLDFLNIFFYARHMESIGDMFFLILSFLLFFFLLVFCSFILAVLLRAFLRSFRLYVKDMFIFSLFLIFAWFLFYILHLVFSFFPWINKLIDTNLWLGNMSFNTIKLLIFYYLLIGIIEEMSKHFNFLSTGILGIKNEKQLVLYSLFVALWFSFLENIFYFFYYANHYWINTSFLGFYFSRSVFSIILHILCSSLLAYSFSRIFFQDRIFVCISSIKVFFGWIFLAIFLHAFFDIALSVWFSAVSYFYFIGGYLYVSSIFYRKSSELAKDFSVSC